MMRNREKFTASSINHQSDVDLKKICLKRGRYSSDYTCTHCFKTFTSAQSFGGHQNAHQAEKKEERRLHVRNPKTYRKQLFLRSLHPPTQPQLHVQSLKAVSAENGKNMHGNQTESKPLLSLDLNLPATGSDDELDEKISIVGNTNTLNKNKDCDDM